MSKPKGIPQDVFAAAFSLLSEIQMKDVRGDPEWDASASMERICNVIMAAEKRGEERERVECAQIVFDTPAAIEHPAGPLYGAGWAAAVQLIRIAIRKRGEG